LKLRHRTRCPSRARWRPPDASPGAAAFTGGGELLALYGFPRAAIADLADRGDGASLARLDHSSRVPTGGAIGAVACGAGSARLGTVGPPKPTNVVSCENRRAPVAVNDPAMPKPNLPANYLRKAFEVRQKAASTENLATKARLLERANNLEALAKALVTLNRASSWVSTLAEGTYSRGARKASGSAPAAPASRARS